MDSARDADLVNAISPRRLYLLLGAFTTEVSNLNCIYNYRDNGGYFFIVVAAVTAMIVTKAT
jgi:hypothetical protein